MKYILTDTFNDRTISTHRTIDAAVKAQIKHQRAVKRANGAHSYIPTMISASDDSDIRNEVINTESRIFQSR